MAKQLLFQKTKKKKCSSGIFQLLSVTELHTMYQNWRWNDRTVILTGSLHSALSLK